MKGFIASLAATAAVATTNNCPKGEFPVLHQYDNNGKGACGCIKSMNDPCRTNKGPKGPHCIPSARCGKMAVKVAKAVVAKKAKAVVAKVAKAAVAKKAKVVAAKIAKHVVAKIAKATKKATSSPAFSFSSIPSAAQTMIVGIVLKERSTLAHCRSLQKKGETACFDGLKSCMNSATCMEDHFKKKHPQCMEQKGCAAGVEGCMKNEDCHQLIVGCIDGPDGCKYRGHNVGSMLMQFNWNALRRSTQLQIVDVINSEHKKMEACGNGNEEKRFKCDADRAKCMKNEKCFTTSFKRDQPKCFASRRCQNNMRLCFNDQLCSEEIKQCLLDPEFCEMNKDSVKPAAKKAAKPATKKVNKPKATKKAASPKKAAKRVAKKTAKSAAKKVIKAKVEKKFAKRSQKAVKKMIKQDVAKAAATAKKAMANAGKKSVKRSMAEAQTKSTKSKRKSSRSESSPQESDPESHSSESESDDDEKK